MNLFVQLLVLTSMCFTVYGLDNGLALTPPMGWLSWERFRCNTDCKNDPDNCISENLYKVMADQMVKDGYLAAGYDHVNIDDCWMAAERDSQGKLVADPDRFPSGMKALADYVHSKGLKLGIYESMGSKTCQGLPGTYGHIETDAKTFAQWGIDMVKMDTCHTPGAALTGQGMKLGIYESMGYKTCQGLPGTYGHIETDAKTFAEWGIDMVKMDKCHIPSQELTQQGFMNMSIAMNKTGRPMIFSCEWPHVMGNKNWTLVAKYCNTWRNYMDVQDSWPKVTNILDFFITNQDAFANVSKPGGYNDPDMLIVGDYSLSYDQSKSQFALWAIMASQMMMSTDLRTLPMQFKEILLNKEIIKVNQDKLGIFGKRIMKTPDNKIEIWTKPLVGGSFAVVFFSRAEDMPRSVTVTPRQLGFKNSVGYIMYELFDHQHLGHYMEDEELSFMVNPVGVVMLRGDPAHGKSKFDSIKTNKIY